MKTPPSTPQRGAASARLLIGIGVAGFFFIVLLNLFGTRLRTVRTTDPSVHSVSAIGHSAFFALLKEIGFNVRDRRFDLEPVPENAVLVIAEPSFLSEELDLGSAGDWFGDPDDEAIDDWSDWEDSMLEEDEEPESSTSPETLRELAESASVAWIVLPKRRGLPEFSWISDHGRVDRDRIHEVLEPWCDEVRLTRGGSEGRDSGSPTGASFWTDHRSLGDLRFDLSVEDLQLLATETPGIRPVIESERGVLVAELTNTPEGSKVFVLTDPDPMANHGVASGDNAAFVVDLIASSAPVAESAPDGERRPIEIVFDEVFHGLASRPSIYESFSQPPLLFILIHVVFLLVALFLCGTRRFGRAIDNEEIEPESDPLIESTVQLLSRGRRDGAAVEAVVAHRVRAMSQKRFGDRAARDVTKAAEQLDALGRTKIRSTELVERGIRLGRGVALAVDVVELARDLSEWETEVERGTR